MGKVDIGGKPVQLNDGEMMIWQGRPVQGILRNPAHIISGIALLGLGFWLISGRNAPLSGTTILGLAVLLAGVYLAYFHAIVEKNRRASTFYAITNQRAIFAYSLRILAYPLSPRSCIELKNGRFDTVIIAEDRRSRVSQGPGPIGFGHLENGQEVYDLLMDIKGRGKYGT